MKRKHFICLVAYLEVSFHVYEIGKGRVYFFLFPSSQRYKVDRAINYLVTHGGCPSFAAMSDVDLR